MRTTTSNMVYIGQRRNISGLSGYGLGDAQIDAQNRVTADMGSVLSAYYATKDSGKLTASYIQSAMNQIQGLINTYANQYAGTKRGEAGRITLQNFANDKIFPPFNTDYGIAFANETKDSGSTPSVASGPDYPIFNGPAASGPTTINVNTSPATAGNIQPSESPGSPSGITIPGTTVDVNSPLAWYENPVMLAVVGLTALMFFAGRKQNR